jgi:hypothetical protein
MRSQHTDDGPLAVLAALVVGALVWFSIGVADLAAQVLR